jgi:nitroreductase
MVLEKPNLTSAIGSILKGKEYTLIDIGIAAEHFCLKATELGLGTCMIGWFDEKKVKTLLRVPGAKRLPLLITIGVSDDEHREKIRKSFSDICSENSY